MQRDQSLRILVNIRKIRKRTLACGQKSRRDDAQTAISRSIAASKGEEGVSALNILP